MTSLYSFVPLAVVIAVVFYVLTRMRWTGPLPPWFGGGDSSGSPGGGHGDGGDGGD